LTYTKIHKKSKRTNTKNEFVLFEMQYHHRFEALINEAVIKGFVMLIANLNLKYFEL